MKSKAKGKNEEARKMFRVSFHKKEHKDVIDIIERSPKTLRCELVAEAIRYFWNNRLDVMTKSDRNSDDAGYVPQGKPLANIGEIFSR